MLNFKSFSIKSIYCFVQVAPIDLFSNISKYNSFDQTTINECWWKIKYSADNTHVVVKLNLLVAERFSYREVVKYI